MSNKSANKEESRNQRQENQQQPKTIAPTPSEKEDSRIRDKIKRCLQWFGKPSDSIAAAAAFIAVVAAAGTIWQAYIARDVERKQMRAYVGLDSIEFEVPDLNNSSYKLIPSSDGRVFFNNFIYITFHNYGQTPANKTSAFVVSVMEMPFIGNLPENYDYSEKINDATRPFPASFVSSEVVEPGRAATRGINLTEDHLAFLRKANNKEGSLYFYGHIDYTDIFNRKWRHYFCWAYEPWRTPGHQFTPYKEHNYEEEIK